MIRFSKEIAHLVLHEIAKGSEDRFGAVNWWCDNCDALLNIQPGFSDSYDTWTCTECGCENELSEENIWDD